MFSKDVPFALIGWDQRKVLLESPDGGSIYTVPVQVGEASSTMGTVEMIRAAAQHVPQHVTVLEVVVNDDVWSLVGRTGGAS